MGETKAPRFPNAYRGSRKILAGCILALISALCFIVYFINDLFSWDPLWDFPFFGARSAEPKVEVLPLVFRIAFDALAVAAILFHLWGLVQASKDEPKFKRAILPLLGGVCLAAVGFFLQDTLKTILLYAAAALGMLNVVFTLRGIISLANIMSKPDIVNKAGRLIVFSTVFFLLCVISGIAFFESTVFLLTLGAALVVAVLYLLLLVQTKDMLAN